MQNLGGAVQPVGRHTQDDVAGLGIGQAVFQADELVWRGVGHGEGVGEVNEETAVFRQTIAQLQRRPARFSCQLQDEGDVGRQIRVRQIVIGGNLLVHVYSIS